MKKIDFKKLVKKEDPKKIIRMYCNSDINLTSNQLDEIIALKNKKENRVLC